MTLFLLYFLTFQTLGSFFRFLSLMKLAPNTAKHLAVLFRLAAVAKRNHNKGNLQTKMAVCVRFAAQLNVYQVRSKPGEVCDIYTWPDL